MTTEPRLRASSRARAGLSIAVAMAVGTSVSAHRLDEYLQATRIDLRADSVAFELALTPGAEIARSIAATIDRNGDGVTSSDEEHAYATAVVRT